ncbi:MAG TPA: DUF6629 family protein [Acidimicrobiales bacterium]|nr:DUF6629 family protein [Acidimicrobiales bacterium]
MCFSPQADLVGGLAISAIGVDVVRHVHRRRDHMALAALPLVLGAHQLDEAFVWWGQQGHVPATVGRVALWVYLLIAFVLLPIFVPAAVCTLEPSTRRRRMMLPFVVIGTVVAAWLLAAMVHGPLGVEVRPYHLAYTIKPSHGLVVITLYVVACCGALLFSSYRHVVLFGAVNLVAVAVIAKLTVDGFASVWCGWAAVTSGVVALHMRVARPHRAMPYVLT